MRARNREISIFNLSMLDVITGAMAAFLIIMIVLMPYYRKEHIDYQVTIAETRQQLEATEAELAAMRAAAASADEAVRQAQAAAAVARAQAEAARQQAQRQQQRAEALARQLAKTFLVLYVRWNTVDDVDLHVVDPSGAEFYWRSKTVPGRPGELSEDTINGPGNEVWEIREAPPGDYKVYVNLFQDKGAREVVTAQGRVFHRDGSNAFRSVRLKQKGDHALVATIAVGADGSVTVR